MTPRDHQEESARLLQFVVDSRDADNFTDKSAQTLIQAAQAHALLGILAHLNLHA